MFERRNNKNDTSFNRWDLERENEELVEPEFSIDRDGRVICEKHSQISRIHALKMAIQQNIQYIRQYESMLTCKTCLHYFNNDCFFPKLEINKIEADRLSNEIQCILCGSRIDRMLTIMNKLYLETKKKNLQIPVICCACYASLNDDTFIQNSRKRMLFFVSSLIISAYFLIYYFWTIISFSSITILLFLIPFIFWVYISLRDVRNVYYLWKGKQYYKEIFETDNSEEEELSDYDEDLYEN